MGANAAIAGFGGWFNRDFGAPDTDERLVAKLRAGDDAAFEAIYERHARGVLAFCLHMLGNREAAEDVLQVTFVSAYRAIRTGSSDICLRPWLYTIARNRCLSELRARRDVVDVEAAMDRPLRDGVADLVQRREDLREMWEDMGRLPADQRAALVLFELGDHSQTEIAEVLGVRREKVKALVFQAREALMRGRRARERPCAEIRERLATPEKGLLPRGMLRAHIDRCPACAAFEKQVRHQRAALALILPVALTAELRASVLRAGAHHGARAAVAASASTAGGVGGAGTLAVGGATTAGGVGGAGAVAAVGTSAAGTAGAAATGAGAAATGAGAAATGAGAAATGAGAAATGAAAAGAVATGTGVAGSAIVAGAPSLAAVATGLTVAGVEYAAPVGVGGLGAAGALGKFLAVAALATAGAGAVHPTQGLRSIPPPVAALLAPGTLPTAKPITASPPSTAKSGVATPHPPVNPTSANPLVPPARSTTRSTTAPPATVNAMAPTTASAPSAAAGTPAASATTRSPAPQSSPAATTTPLPPPTPASTTPTSTTTTPTTTVDTSAGTTTPAPAPSSSPDSTGTTAPSAPAGGTTSAAAPSPTSNSASTAAPSTSAGTTDSAPAPAPNSDTTSTAGPSQPSTQDSGTSSP